MYEFFDAYGERVTVRSARTLGRLLSDGQIIAATRFRRTDEAEFEPAGTHAELCGIAAQFGISLGEPSGADAAPGPAAPFPEQPSYPAPLLEQPSYPAPLPEQPSCPAPLPEQPHIAVPPETTELGFEPLTAVRSEPSAVGPWSALAHSAQPLGAPASGRQHPFRSTQKRVGELGPLSREGSPRRIGIVLSYCFAAALGGLAAGALAAIVLQQPALLMLAAGLGSGALAWVAERSLSARRPAIKRWEIAVGSVIFGAACLVLTRGPGLVVALPVCAALWAKLRARNA